MYNGCGDFSRLLETGTDESRLITIEAKYEGCACSQMIKEETVSYEVKAGEAGEYELRFSSVDDEFIVKRLTVE